MTPKSFDVATAKEWIGDDRMRTLEAKARSDAENGKEGFDPPKFSNTGNYATQVSQSMDATVYFNAFQKRLERNLRKANQ